MTKDQFVNHVMCKPWVKNACGPDAYDCWGLIVAYFRDVLNIELPIYDHGDIHQGFLSQINSGQWAEGEGIVFMAFSDGIPQHCGLIFGNRVIHSSGDNGMGQVTSHPLRFIKRIFPDVRVYDFNQA